jgi:hypothetical protein
VINGGFLIYWQIIRIFEIFEMINRIQILHNADLLCLLCLPLSIDCGGASTKADGSEALAGIDLEGCRHLQIK